MPCGRCGKLLCSFPRSGGRVLCASTAPAGSTGDFSWLRTCPQWNGSGFISGLAGTSHSRVIFDGRGGAKLAKRWNVGKRIRDARLVLDWRHPATSRETRGGRHRVPEGARAGARPCACCGGDDGNDTVTLVRITVDQAGACHTCRQRLSFVHAVHHPRHPAGH